MAPLAPVVPEASNLLYDSWSSERRYSRLDDGRIAGLEASLEASLEPGLEPGPGHQVPWASPARFLDEFVRRGRLTLPERYGRYLRRSEDPALSRRERAVYSYLAGRLGGERGRARLVQAAELDSSLGWAWHGLGWRSFSGGDTRRAIGSAERAVRLARDPHELAHFASALARYLSQDKRNSAAQGVLASALMAEGALALRADERNQLTAELAGVELESLSTADVRRGVRRSLDALMEPGLTYSERLTLILALRGTPVGSGAVAEEEIAFAVLEGAEAAGLEGSADMERGAAMERLMDALLADDRGSGPGLDGVSSGRVRPGNGRSERLVRAFFQPLAGGAAQAELEAWLDELPAALQGGPVEPRVGAPISQTFARDELRELHVVLAEVPRGAEPVSQEVFELVGAALMRAGWFREARALGEGVIARRSTAPGQGPILTAARGLQRDAIAARALLGGIGALARRIDAREAFVQAGAVGTEPLESVEGGRLESLRELHDEVLDLFARYGAAAAVPAELESPVIRYGPLGQIVHPGPHFSPEDEAQGRGVLGEEVPGVASLFRRMGRFALLGKALGQGGPDATVLRVVGVEWRSGEHLGRPYRGTVFWCDGADVPGRFGRRGASISGAALHEGYYVDLAMVRIEEAQWNRLRERFLGDRAGVQRALGAPGAGVPKRYRAEVTPALGAADRMRLAVMGSGTEGGELEAMTLARLAEVVAVHEEGHLCDRASWYPLSLGRLVKLIGFAGAHGFRGGRIGQALEERAQLVALCEVADVRLAWIDLLDAAENSGGGGVTPHAAAYRRLLKDLVERLDEEFEAGEWRGVGLREGERWLDQLHRVDPELLRGLARREARSRGM